MSQPELIAELATPANWMSWGSSLFIGKTSELAFLSHHLISPKAHCVAITGTYGAGKTALAMTFGRLHQDAFPAGIYHVYPSELESLEESISSKVSHPSEPYLLILDEIDRKQPDEAIAELEAVRVARPSARIICIGIALPWARRLDAVLEIKGLNRAEYLELLHTLGKSLGEKGDELFSSLNGNPRFALEARAAMDAEIMTPRELILRLQRFRYSGLVGADGRPLSRDENAARGIIVDIAATNDDLLRSIHANPRLMHDLSPREFEYFVGDILKKLGYDVTITKATRDGGKDIFAAKKDHLGTFLYLVECKKYAPDNAVGVHLIRELAGVLYSARATAGILATTSYFSKDAKEFQSTLSHQISLKDYIGIHGWLNAVVAKV